jgi:hypothetical protein
MKINQILISREGKYDATLNIHFCYSTQTCKQNGLARCNVELEAPNSFLSHVFISVAFCYRTQYGMVLVSELQCSQSCAFYGNAIQRYVQAVTIPC